jgi:murein DD-endopeptidase MepM/ murein hydrolase activator NlpD
MSKLKSINKIIPVLMILFVMTIFITCSPASTFSQQGSTPKFDSNIRVNLHGISFHDYNGNGTKEYNEPVLPLVDLEFINIESSQKFKVHTDEKGAFTLSLPPNKYKITTEKEILGDNGQPFRYIYTSAKEINSLEKPLPVILNQDKIYNLALTQGFLTLPYSIATNSYITAVFFDIDRRENLIRDWQGKQDTYDQHSGTDYRIPIGTPVLAAAPGRVISSEFDKRSGNVITISHGLILTRYGHLSKRNVRAGDIVLRGQQIGLSGETGEWVGTLPHLHFELNITILPGVDPYRDITNPESTGYWTLNNKPQYP